MCGRKREDSVEEEGEKQKWKGERKRERGSECEWTMWREKEERDRERNGESVLCVESMLLL